MPGEKAESSLSRSVPEVFGVEVQDGDCDVIAEQANDVARQRQQVKQPSIVDSVFVAAECVPDEMRRCILINWL